MASARVDGALALLTGSTDGRLAVILAGRTGPLRDMLHITPALTARFPAVFDFPGYTAGQLTAIFVTLAGEAGFSLTRSGRKAATVLAQAEAGHGSGNGRLAVRLLDQVTVSQPARSLPAPSLWIRLCCAMLSTYRRGGHNRIPPAEDWPDQYL